jgi:hypothetical protein
MSPPINIDGAQVQEITIDGESVSEVTMDGDEVFGGAIPDSVVNNMDNYYFTDEGSGQTLVDDGSPTHDFSITGGTWQSGVGQNGVYLQLDGTDDYLDNQDGSYWDTETISFGKWLNPDNTSDSQTVVGAMEANATSAFEWVLDIGVSSSGEIRLIFGDGTIQTSTAITASDWQFVGLSADVSANTVNVYHGLDSDSDLTNIMTMTDYTTIADAIGRMAIGATVNDDGSGTSRHFGAGIDLPMFNVGSAVSQSTFESIFDDTKGNF